MFFCQSYTNTKRFSRGNGQIFNNDNNKKDCKALTTKNRQRLIILLLTVFLFHCNNRNQTQRKSQSSELNTGLVGGGGGGGVLNVKFGTVVPLEFEDPSSFICFLSMKTIPIQIFEVQKIYPFLCYSVIGDPFISIY